MARRLISSGSTFEKSIGYSRAVVDGDWIFVSGTTGFDYSNMTISDDVVTQCAQALKNIEAALKQASSGFADVVRVRYLMTNGPDFERCWETVGKVFADVRPACTVEVVGLTDPRMQIEIEVTALRRKTSVKSKAKGKAKTAAKAKKKGKPKATKKK
ncbi:MAG: RidA family protein [Steroidobacteraceae bacterium]|nr:RidA family protein [Steroidobacteraceae bacterium]